MKKIIPLIFSVLYALSSNAQAVGGWGTCEFADVATMNAFDPSTNAYDCKKVFVQATNNHYYWNGTIWVLVQDTDDQNASEVPFTPVGSIVATDVQAAIAEIEPDIYGSIDVHSDVDVSTTAPSNGDVLSWDGTNFVPTAGVSTNLYSDDGTLDEARTLSLGGFNLNISDSGSEKIQIGTFGGNGGGKLQVDVSDGDGMVQGIKTVIQQTTGTNYAINGTAEGVGATTNTALYGWASGATNNYGLRVESGWGIFDDRVGIGTTSPDAMLDVEGGTVRLSDYGGGTITGYLTRILGVNITGDVIEVDPSTFGSADNLGSHTAEENIQMDDFWISNDGDDEGIYINGSGDIGIGTESPDALLDVEGGTVRFSDYGGGTVTGTLAYYLAVDTNGDVIEVAAPTSSNNYIRNISTSTITFNGSDEDDLTPTGFTSSPFYQVYRVNVTSDTDLTGISSSGVVDGQLITLLNISSNKKIKIKHQDGGSSAANRIIGPKNGDEDIDDGEAITLIYDATSARWRVFSIGQ